MPVKQCKRLWLYSLDSDTIIIIIMLRVPWAGKTNQILSCDWLAERVRWSFFLGRLGLPIMPLKKNFPEKPCNKSVIEQMRLALVWWRWLGIGLARLKILMLNISSFFEFMDLTPVSVHNWTSKKRTRPVSSHPDFTLGK